MKLTPALIWGATLFAASCSCSGNGSGDYHNQANWQNLNLPHDARPLQQYNHGNAVQGGTWDPRMGAPAGVAGATGTDMEHIGQVLGASGLPANVIDKLQELAGKQDLDITKIYDLAIGNEVLSDEEKEMLMQKINSLDAQQEQHLLELIGQ